MNRDALQAVVEDNIGRTDKNSVILNGLNFALRELLKEHDFREMFVSEDKATVASQAYVSLTSSLDRIYEARLINSNYSYSLSLKTKKWVVSRWPNLAALSTGMPSFGYVESGKLYLGPIPNAVYTIRLTKIAPPGDLASGSTANPVESLDYAITCWATGFVYDSLKMFDEGQAWRARALDSVHKAHSFDERHFEERALEGFNPSTPQQSATPWLDPFSGLDERGYY
jgi:hypothetical protein